MKILVISREFPPYVAGGISYHLKNLYECAVELGHKVTILAGRPRSTDKTESISVPDLLDIKWIDYYSISGYHLQFPVALYKELREIPVGSYDIALTHTEIPYALQIPTVHKVHDAKHRERQFSRNQMGNFTKMAESVLAQTRRWTTQRAIDNADGLIFNSDLTNSVWKDAYEIACQTLTIYNGVDQSIFYPRDINDNEYVLFVGDNTRKGLTEIKEFAKRSDYPIYVVGNIDDTQYLQEIGRVSQQMLAEYYTGATATIHPAKFEAFGNVVLESLACGTPVVVSDRCGASEIIDDSCGRVTNDLDSGIETVKDINQAPCVEKANHYSWENVAARTILFARRILKQY